MNSAGLTSGLGMIGLILLVKLVFIVVWVGIPLLLVAALVLWTTGRRKVSAGQLVQQLRSARLRGLRYGALIGALAVIVSQPWLGPIAVAAGYLYGVFTGDLRAAPPRTGVVRVASLQPRTAKHYVPRWAAGFALLAGAMIIGAPAVFAAVPTASYGPWHPFPEEPSITLPGQTLSWPTPATWIPLVVAAGGALVVGALLIRRVLRLPAATADAPGVLESTRRNAARTITGTVLGVELLALGALTLVASSGLGVPESIDGGAYTASRILVWSGLGLVLAGIMVWCVLSRWRRSPLDSGPAASPLV